MLELLDPVLHDELTAAKLPYREVQAMKDFRASGWSLKRIGLHYGVTATLVALALQHIPLEHFKPAPVVKLGRVPLSIKRKTLEHGITSAGVDLAPEDSVVLDPLSLL